MGLNTTVNNISVISWQPFCLISVNNKLKYLYLTLTRQNSADSFPP